MGVIQSIEDAVAILTFMWLRLGRISMREVGELAF